MLLAALRRPFAIAVILMGLVGLGINFQLFIGGDGSGPIAPRGFLDAVVHFWTYFTHVTNLWLVLCYVSELTGWRGLSWLRHPVGRASMAGSITLVMVFYHFMLAPNFDFQGWLLVANVLMHYVTPLLYLAWWAVFCPHGTLRFASAPLMLVPGLVYVAWALAYGAIAGTYPYDILDVSKAGYGGVAIGVGILVVLVALFCLLLVVIDRWLGRRPGAAARP